MNGTYYRGFREFDVYFEACIIDDDDDDDGERTFGKISRKRQVEASVDPDEAQESKVW